MSMLRKRPSKEQIKFKGKYDFKVGGPLITKDGFCKDYTGNPTWCRCLSESKFREPIMDKFLQKYFDKCTASHHSKIADIKVRESDEIKNNAKYEGFETLRNLHKHYSAILPNYADKNEERAHISNDAMDVLQERAIVKFPGFEDLVKDMQKKKEAAKETFPRRGRPKVVLKKKKARKGSYEKGAEDSDSDYEEKEEGKEEGELEEEEEDEKQDENEVEEEDEEKEAGDIEEEEATKDNKKRKRETRKKNRKVTALISFMNIAVKGSCTICIHSIVRMLLLWAKKTEDDGVYLFKFVKEDDFIDTIIPNLIVFDKEIIRAFERAERQELFSLVTNQRIATGAGHTIWADIKKSAHPLSRLRVLKNLGKTYHNWKLSHLVVMHPNFGLHKNRATDLTAEYLLKKCHGAMVKLDKEACEFMKIFVEGGFPYNYFDIAETSKYCYVRGLGQTNNMKEGISQKLFQKGGQAARANKLLKHPGLKQFGNLIKCALKEAIEGQDKEWRKCNPDITISATLSWNKGHSLQKPHYDYENKSLTYLARNKTKLGVHEEEDYMEIKSKGLRTDEKAGTRLREEAYIGFAPLDENGMYLEVWAKGLQGVGTMMYIPFGMAIVLRGDTIHAGGFFTSGDGCPRMHMYLYNHPIVIEGSPKNKTIQTSGQHKKDILEHSVFLSDNRKEKKDVFSERVNGNNWFFGNLLDFDLEKAVYKYPSIGLFKV